MTKGYAQTYGVDYSDTFSSVAKLTSVRLFISMAATHNWPLHQLDIKMCFYMETFKKKSIWSNHMVLLLRGSMGKSAIFASLYMV